MEREAVQLVVLQIRLAGERILWLKLYRDGTVVREGVGGKPIVDVSGCVNVGGSQMFDLMMAVVEDPLLEKSRGYRDENINTPLEYVVAFFGDSANGETGERAEWRQSVGLQIQVELRGRKRPPILSVVDRLCIRAVELTQSLYFDMVIYAVFGMKSNQLPTGLISQPQNGEEKANAWGNLMQQLLGNPEKWKLDDLAANKIYQTPDGRPFRLRFDLSGNQFRYDFVPL